MNTKPKVVYDYSGQQYVQECEHRGNMSVKRNYPVMH